ncbi:P-loop containing nucleoside triphosphate hydrolase protein [Ascobolus immersus RN42]|uniref:P-loop containing nucleoside triphosphate hydrolase protein n=1 Tax=Ascobolus immersus RN42 TaxID=1160509 RepID=A0A3N4HPP5_ASCIM|nr:P-loop containing nucleoside triphosphate hydrolase protein [Ascobolus immersus RN42]
MATATRSATIHQEEHYNSDGSGTVAGDCTTSDEEEFSSIYEGGGPSKRVQFSRDAVKAFPTVSVTEVDHSDEECPPPVKEIVVDEPVIIAVMGVTGSGKSTFIQLASQQEVQIGDNLESCTQEISRYEYKQGRKTVHLIDTPGFDDTNRTDTDTLEALAEYLAQMYRTNTRLAGIIYLHRIKDGRMQGSALRNLRMFRKLCGDDPLKNVVLATTFWEEVAPEVGASRERELSERDDWWGAMQKRGSVVTRLDKTQASARRLVGAFFNAQPVTLQIQAEIVHQNKTLVDTQAGEYLNQQLVELRKRHEAAMVKIQKELEEAIGSKDHEYKELLEAERVAMMKKIRDVENEQEKLKESGKKAQEELKQSLFARLRDKEEADRLSRERVEQIKQTYDEQNKDLKQRVMKQQDIIENAQSMLDDIRREREEEKLRLEREKYERLLREQQEELDRLKKDAEEKKKKGWFKIF